MLSQRERIEQTIERMHKEEAVRKLALINKWHIRMQKQSEAGKVKFSNAIRYAMDWFQEHDISVSYEGGVYIFPEED